MCNKLMILWQIHYAELFAIVALLVLPNDKYYSPGSPRYSRTASCCSGVSALCRGL